MVLDSRTQPIALIIEDNRAHARMAVSLFRRIKYRSMVCTTLLDGESRARELLDLRLPWQPVVVVIDQELLVDNEPGLEGATLALLLNEEMKAGTLHPAYLVALSVDMSASRRELADYARCVFRWEKPLTFDRIQQINDLVRQGPPQIDEQQTVNTAILSLAKSNMHLLKTMAAQARAVPRLWAPDEVRGLISLHSPAVYIRAKQIDAINDLLHEFGGLTRVTLLLRDAAHGLDADLHAMLDLLLHGGYQAGEIQQKLNLSRRLYDRRLRQLCRLLATELSASSRSHRHPDLDQPDGR